MYERIDKMALWKDYNWNFYRVKWGFKFDHIIRKSRLTLYSKKNKAYTYSQGKIIKYGAINKLINSDCIHLTTLTAFFYGSLSGTMTKK